MNILKRLAQKCFKFMLEDLDGAGKFHLMSQALYGKTKGNGGRLFFSNLIRYLYHGKCKTKEVDALVYYISGDGRGRLEPFFFSNFHQHPSVKNIKMTLENAIESLGTEMDIDFANLAMGKCPLVVTKLIKTDIMTLEQCQDRETSIRELYKDTYPEYQPDVEIFYRFNNLLAPEDRLKFCPDSGYADGFVDFTEAALRQILKVQKDFPKTPIKGTLIQHFFGTKLGRKTSKYGLLSEIDPESPQQKRFLLSQTIRTDGQSVQFLFLDLDKPPPPRAKKAVSASFTDQAAKKQKKKRINKSLQTVVPERYAAHPEEYTITGLDIGEVNLVGTCTLPADRPEKKLYANTKVKAVTEPLRRFRYDLKKRKEDYSISFTATNGEDVVKEVDIAALEMESKQLPGESYLDYFKRWRDVLYPFLGNFYNSKGNDVCLTNM